MREHETQGTQLSLPNPGQAKEALLFSTSPVDFWMVHVVACVTANFLTARLGHKKHCLVCMNHVVWKYSKPGICWSRFIAIHAERERERERERNTLQIKLTSANTCTTRFAWFWRLRSSAAARIVLETKYKIQFSARIVLTRFYESTLACYYFAKSQCCHVYIFDTQL